MAHTHARRVLAILSLFALGVGPCGGPTPTPEAQPIVAAIPSATPTPTVAVKPSATPTPTDTKIPPKTPTATATATATVDKNSQGSQNNITVDMAGSAIVQEAAVAGLKLNRTVNFGSQYAQGLEGWFGALGYVSPFTAVGLQSITMGLWDTGGSRCTKFCYAIKSVLIFSDGAGPIQAVPLVLDYEQVQDKTLVQMTDAQLTPFATDVLSNTHNLVGTIGNIGQGKYATPAFSVFAPYGNALVVFQVGSVPNAIAPGDMAP